MVVTLGQQYNTGEKPSVIIVAAWVYDGIISSGVNRWGRDVHCIIGVLGKSSHMLCRSLSRVRVKGRGRLGSVVNRPQRPLASLLRETNYASLTTKCLLMYGICEVPNASPRPSAFHDSSSVQLGQQMTQVKSPFCTVLPIQDSV